LIGDVGQKEGDVVQEVSKVNDWAMSHTCNWADEPQVETGEKSEKWSENE